MQAANRTLPFLAITSGTAEPVNVRGIVHGRSRPERLWLSGIGVRGMAGRFLQPVEI